MHIVNNNNKRKRTFSQDEGRDRVHHKADYQNDHCVSLSSIIEEITKEIMEISRAITSTKVRMARGEPLDFDLDYFEGRKLFLLEERFRISQGFTQ